MNFRTKITLAKSSKNQIDYKSKILLLGSCFSENIGNKFNFYKFNSLQNPFGILFHPKAIERLIVNAINQKKYIEKDIFLSNEHWHCFEAHSKISSTSKDDLLENLNRAIELTDKKIQDSTHIIITLGTSWIYRFKETTAIVANCHKVPQKEFEKELLSIEQIEQSLINLIDTIKNKNSDVDIIFTVSPVRHLKDGFIENTLSKAHLIAAIHSVLSLETTSNNLYYFPSYEIMMDELRDYRFYGEDMVHPNQIAIDYIWEKFSEVWISKESFKIMDEVESIQKGLQHKPFNPNSEAHKQFLQKIERKKEHLSQLYNHISF